MLRRRECGILLTLRLRRFLGLPMPQKNHASIMVRFASDCRNKMKEVVNELDERLQTKHLQIRIGLSSGPVTAGVLRGKKARFQLFGTCCNRFSFGLYLRRSSHCLMLCLSFGYINFL